MRALILVCSLSVLSCSSSATPATSNSPVGIGDAAPRSEAASPSRAGSPAQVCTPESKSCDDNAVWGCSEDGSERVFMGYCASGSLCESGECVCIPQCTGRACGDDACGGECGECGEGATCMPDGSCCDRGCDGRVCGPDACGGTCGVCEDELVCVGDSGQCCAPACEGKTCGPDGCGGQCGSCEAGVPCPLGGVCGCEPECEDKSCGPDGCGGLCGGCFTFEEDDGSTETAFGYESPPASDPYALVCMVRIRLPHTNMRLTSFSAGWMYGLWELQVPFELVVAPASEMGCVMGDEDTWWTEACLAPEDVLTPLTSLLPAPPYEPQPAEELGEHVMPASEIFIGTRFLVAEYPIYVCPVDESSSGADSFMFPLALEEGVGTLNASSMQTKEGSVGAMALRFGFELSPQSVPVSPPSEEPP